MKKLQILLSEAEMSSLKSEAARRGTTMTQMIRDFISIFLKEREEIPLNVGNQHEARNVQTQSEAGLDAI